MANSSIFVSHVLAIIATLVKVAIRLTMGNAIAVQTTHFTARPVTNRAARAVNLEQV